MIAARRLTAQRIARPTDAKPADVVAALGAVQAQDYAAAKWAIGLRLASATSDAAVERAIDEGALVRTHAFRGTWQLIARGDVRWMLALVAPRLIASNATPYHMAAGSEDLTTLCLPSLRRRALRSRPCAGRPRGRVAGVAAFR